MSVVFTNPEKLYPVNKIDSANYSIASVLEITADLAHNPVKTALAAFRSLANADLLWLVNNIQDPYKELYEGLVIQVPLLTQASSVAIKTSVTEKVNVKNAKISGQTIVY